MLTIFAIPKPFNNHVGIIQRNALRSWTMFRPTCEIILCGDALGVKEAAIEFGAKHLSDISCNEFGTPYLDSAFEKVVNVAHFPIVCYVNADIILLNDLLDAIKRIPFNKFVAVGRRTDVEIRQQWDFETSNWRSQLVKFAIKNGQLASGDGIDYFVFTPNGCIEKLPSFVIGRPAWDNWFVANALINRVPIIDITRACTVIHQNHDYSHVPLGRNKLWNGPEADENRDLFEKLVGKLRRLGNIWNATHILTRKFLLPALGPRYLRQHWYSLVYLHPSLKPIADILDPIFRLPKWIKVRSK